MWGSVAVAAAFTVCTADDRPGVENKEHIMNTIATGRKSVTAALGAAVAAAAMLLSLGAGISHASDFDPQPDPPGQSRGFQPAA